MNKTSDARFALARHPAAALIRFGNFEYDLREPTLRIGGEDLELPPRALAVLDCLLQRRGQIVSKDALIRDVWNGAHVADASVTEAVSLLRQALGDSAQDPRYIRTVHRRGYRFVADVRPVSSSPAEQAEPEPTANSAPLTTADDETIAPPSGTESSLWRRRYLLALGAVLTLVVHGLLLRLGATSEPAAGSDAARADATPPSTRFVVPLGDEIHVNKHLPALALSRDGRQLAWVVGKDGKSAIEYRSMDQVESRVLPGTDDATTPFFSPDGRWLGYFADRKLWKIDPSTGSRVVICEASDSLGATWGDDGTIVFAPHPGTVLLRVAESGGEAEVLAASDPSAGEVALLWPRHLPDGHLLVTAWANTVASASILRLDPETGARKVVAESAADPHWLSHPDPDRVQLLFSRPEGVVTASYDLTEGRLGTQTSVLEGILTEPFSGLLQLATASNGTLAFLPGREGTDVEHAQRQLVRVDLDGRVTSLPTPSRYYRNLESSPDGTRLAVTIAEGSDSDVWIVDLESGALRRLTFEGFDIEPVWTPDGRAVTFSSDRGGHYGIYRKNADGSGAAELLFEVPRHAYPWAWLPDGSGLVYSEAHPQTSWDLWLWTPDGERKPLLATNALESGGAPSPGGDLLAAEVAVNGSWRLLLYEYPDLESRWQITTDGGWFPFWSEDGTRLYYVDREGLREVVVRQEGRVLPEPPRTVVDDELNLDMIRRSGDGFVAIQREPFDSPHAIQVVLNWTPNEGST